jgi:segregation and condensation protein B
VSAEGGGVDEEFDVESTAEELPEEPDEPVAGDGDAGDGAASVGGAEAPADAAGTGEAEGDGILEAPLPPEQSGLASLVESLLFLSSEPVLLDDLAVACDTGPEEVSAAIEELRRVFAPGRRGLLLRELGGGFLLSSAPETEPAARRLLAAPRTPPLTPAQAETLAIVAYLQPVSRPEITRIRGVAADSACNTLTERGMIEEAGRSQFGAVLYRTTGLFLRLFGLDGLADLPDPSAWDPTPEETATLRERLMIAGDARGGSDAVQGDDPTERPTLDLSGAAAPAGHAASEFAGTGEDSSADGEHGPPD